MSATPQSTPHNFVACETPETPGTPATVPVRRGGRPWADFAICALIIVASVLVLPAAMMTPWAYLTVFPPPPKSEAQVLTEKMAELGLAFDAESFKRGKSLFAVNCVACHTPDGGARPNLGKDVVHSAFTARSSDKELVTFLKLGRNPGDPLNTTGVGMPPKGGNPALMDKDLADLITFIRGRQVAEDVSFK